MHSTDLDAVRELIELLRRRRKWPRESSSRRPCGQSAGGADPGLSRSPLAPAEISGACLQFIDHLTNEVSSIGNRGDFILPGQKSDQAVSNACAPQHRHAW